jgi:hypothetical protein
MSCGLPGWHLMRVSGAGRAAPATSVPGRRARALRCRRELALRPRKGQPEAALAVRAACPAAPAPPAAPGAGAAAAAARFGRAPPCCRSRHFSAMRAAPPRRRTASLTQSACRAGRAQGRAALDSDNYSQQAGRGRQASCGDFP